MIVDQPPQPMAHVARCHTRRCWRRVHRSRVVRLKWRRIRAHPMPVCTWVRESGPVARFGEFQRARYRVMNISAGATAGGKFQIIRQTWLAYGGRDYHPRYPAAYAPPLEQEHLARLILRRGGLSQWERC